LQIVATNVAAAQQALGRCLSIENPATYLKFRHSPIPEAEFLGELVRRTGCRDLCDVNNVVVSAVNLDLDGHAYLDTLPRDAVAEIDAAGHSRIGRGGRTIAIDGHASNVGPDVSDLYRCALARFGMIPTLVEWDTRIPELQVLLAEAGKVQTAARSQLAASARPACLRCACCKKASVGPCASGPTPRARRWSAGTPRRREGGSPFTATMSLFPSPRLSRTPSRSFAGWLTVASSPMPQMSSYALIRRLVSAWPNTAPSFPASLPTSSPAAPCPICPTWRASNGS